MARGGAFAGTKLTAESVYFSLSQRFFCTAAQLGLETQMTLKPAEMEMCVSSFLKL